MGFVGFVGLNDELKFNWLGLGLISDGGRWLVS